MLLLEDRRFFVYMLVDPDTNIPFYIGKGKGNRPKDHIIESKKNKGNKSPKVAKIRKILKDNKMPLIFFIKKNLTEEESFDYEWYYLNKLCFSLLTNISFKKGVGGDNTSFHPNRDDIYKKSSLRLKEQIEKRIGKNYEEIYGKEKSLEEKEKRKKALLGRKRPEDVLKKISESLKGKTPWNKGLKVDDNRVKKYISKMCKKVLCIETGEIFESRKDAIAKYGNSVSFSIKSGKKIKGLSFIYYKEGD